MGRQRETQGNLFEIMADPTRPTKINNDPVILEIRRLWDKGIKVSPTLLGTKAGYSSLTKEQNTSLLEKAGKITHDKLASLFVLDSYTKKADDEKGKLIESIADKSKISARVEMVLSLVSGITDKEELSKKLSELKSSGLMTRDVYNKYLELK